MMGMVKYYLYRVFRVPGTYISFAVTMAGTLLLAFLSLELNAMAITPYIGASPALFVGCAFASSVVFSSDYRNGTAKNYYPALSFKWQAAVSRIPAIIAVVLINFVLFIIMQQVAAFLIVPNLMMKFELLPVPLHIIAGYMLFAFLTAVVCSVFGSMAGELIRRAEVSCILSPVICSGIVAVDLTESEMLRFVPRLNYLYERISLISLMPMYGRFEAISRNPDQIIGLPRLLSYNSPRLIAVAIAEVLLFTVITALSIEKRDAA